MYKNYRKVLDLVNSKARVDSSAIDFFTLNIQPSNRRPHSLGAYSNHANVLGEVLPQRLQVPQKKSM